MVASLKKTLLLAFGSAALALVARWYVRSQTRLLDAIVELGGHSSDRWALYDPFPALDEAPLPDLYGDCICALCIELNGSKFGLWQCPSHGWQVSRGAPHG